MTLEDSKKHGIYAIEYDELSKSMDWHGQEALFGMVFEYVKPGQTLLDLGIGTGASAFLFHKAGLEVYGVDYSEDMLRICAGKNIVKELKVYDISRDNWPYNKEEFYHVISCGVFHFLRDLDTAFMEVHRILKTEGVFCFTIKEATGCKTEYTDPGSGIAVYCHRESYIEGLIKKYGFIFLKRMAIEAYNDPAKKERSVFAVYVLKRSPYSTI